MTVTTDTVAAELGVSREAVHNALNRGQLPGFKVGNAWFLLHREQRADRLGVISRS